MKAHSFDRAEIYARLFVKQRGRCKTCNVFSAHLAIDHIVPRSRGGADTPANWQLLCRSCNSQKNARQDPGTQHTIFDKPSADVPRSDLANGAAARKRAQRARARAEGRCIICCREAVTIGKSTCHGCGAKANAAKKGKAAAA